MTVNQASQRAVINWNTFNVGSNASVNFVQPNAQAVTLNRVNDSNPSQIFGRISANGQVFLTNANGIYFSRTSSVDVGAFTATTHSITDDNFMSGKYVFERNGATGKIINEGNITAALGGYVALLAPEVQNAGVVVARAGTVAMAAGETITLNIDGLGGLAGITTTPSAIASLIENKLAVQAPDGQIILSSVALNKLQTGLIKNSGSLEANSLVNKGGKIYLEGDNIILDRNSKIEAKGPKGGGTVLVGGDWQGSGTLRQATKVTMDIGATIDASGTDNGDGGKVVLWSDLHNADSETQVNGIIKAEAGPNGGNGGQIETSGHYLNVDNIKVSTNANGGKTGHWLLDPYDITIAHAPTPATGTTWAAGTSTTAGTVTYTPSATSTVLDSTINTALSSSNVTLSTAGAGSNAGNITTEDNASLSWSSAKVLTLQADGGVFGGASITMSNAGAGLVINQAGDSYYIGKLIGSGTFTKTGLGNFNLRSDSVTFTGSANINQGTLQLGSGTTVGALGGGGSGGSTNTSIYIANGATLAYNLNAYTNYSAPATAQTQPLNVFTGTGTIANFARPTTGTKNLDLSLADLSNFNGTYSVYVNEGALIGSTPALAKITLGNNPNLTNATFNVVTSGYAASFTNVQGVTWGGAATGIPLLKANGIAMTSGVMGLGATLTLNATNLTIGQGGAWSLTGNVNGANGTTYLPQTNSAAYTLSGTVTADVLSGLTVTQSGALTQRGGATNGDLVVNGNGGTLVLSANNSYAGTTTINSGTLQVGTDSTNAGTLGAGGIYNNANLNFFRFNGYSLSALASYAGGITGSGNVKVQSRGFVTIDRDITLNGASSRIDLFAGSNLTQGVTTGGADLTLSNTITTSDSGTFNIFTGTPNFYADGTSTLISKMVGATGALKYKTYNTTVSTMPSAVLGTRNFNYRQAVAVTTSAAILTKTYDGTTSTVGSTLTGGAVTGAIDGDSFTASISGGTYASPPNAGTNITITGATASIAATSGTGWSLSGYTTSLGAVSGVINKANLTITPTTGLSKTYGGSDPSFTYTPSGFVNGETSIAGLSGVLTRAPGENVGTYAYSVSGLSSTNYTFTMVGSPSQFTINKANLTVTPTTGLTKIYGALDPTLTYTTSVLLNSDTSIAGLGGTLTRATGENAGNYAYSVSGLSSTNYTFTMVGSPSEFAISARPITVTASTLNKVYGNADPALTYSLTSGSMANSETLSGALSRANGEAVGNYAISQGTLAASSNYTLTYAAANLVIDPRPVSLTGQMNYSGQPTLDTTQTGTTLSATNVVLGDSLTLSGTAPLASAAAGTRAITAFNSLNLNNSNYTTSGASGSVTVIPTGGINVTPLNNTEVAALIGSQLAGLTASQIATFSTTQLQVFSWQQIAAISPSQFAGLTAAQLASLSSTQLQGLSAAQLSFMTPTQLGGLSPSQFAGLNNVQLQALSAAQVRAISTEQLSLLSPVQIMLLSGNAATPLSLQQIMALTPAQIGGISTVQVARLTAAEFSSLSNDQLLALSLEQLAVISPTSLAALSSEQVMALSLTQVASLTPDQLRSFSPTQIASLSADEVASFNAQQLAAIGIFPRVVMPDEAPVATAKFEAPIPVMTEVATPNLPSGEVAVAAPAMPSTSSVKTLQEAPVGTGVSDSGARTGVLAITVLSGTDARPDTTGVAFEQDANGVSLRLTSAPSVLPVFDKLIFNDKMTTFMVAQADGQMVEFQGGLINKRLVIVAPSSAAKQIARTEMSIVLAAAITTLGTENRVVLANLDGVVIDLR